MKILTEGPFRCAETHISYVVLYCVYFYTVSHPITIMFSDERNYTLSLLGTSCKHCIYFIHFTYFTCVLSPMTVHVIIDVYDILVLSRLCCTDYCRLSFLVAAHFHCYTSSHLYTVCCLSGTQANNIATHCLIRIKPQL